MRIFDRLRKFCRKQAEINGHDLGVFLECDTSNYHPYDMVYLFSGKMYDGVKWYKAKCIKCGTEVMISDTLSPVYDDIRTGPNYVFDSVKETEEIRIAQIHSGEKVTFSEKSRGIVGGLENILKRCSSI